MSEKQVQKAGDNSQQIQAATVIINNNGGITEERAREIYSEMSALTRTENTYEAEAKAIDKINKLEEILIPRIEKEDKLFECFADPAFQVLLRKAQMTAICSERDSDYKIISELLVHRNKNKENRKKKASITKAVEIIDQIDDDALLALTVFLTISSFVPATGDISKGLKILSELYDKFDLDSLPKDNLWQDNLLILGAITIDHGGHFKKLEEFFASILSGYVCVGIKKDSDEYTKAIEVLQECNLTKEILVEHELVEGYVRIPIRANNKIEDLNQKVMIICDGKSFYGLVPLTDVQKEAVKKVLNMYSQDAKMVSLVKENFVKLMNSHPTIQKVMAWWDSIKGSFSLTSIGKVIGHTNAKSIDNSLPDLD